MGEAGPPRKRRRSRSQHPGEGLCFGAPFENPGRSRERSGPTPSCRGLRRPHVSVLLETRSGRTRRPSLRGLELGAAERVWSGREGRRTGGIRQLGGMMELGFRVEGRGSGLASVLRGPDPHCGGARCESVSRRLLALEGVAARMSYLRAACTASGLLGGGQGGPSSRRERGRAP